MVVRDNMTSRSIISILLLIAVFIPFFTVPNINSQSGAAYTVVNVNTPPPRQCSLLPLAFSAQKGQAIQGSFTADVTLDFYILTENDFNAFVQWNTCALPQTAFPLFMLQQVIELNTTYNAAIPNDGTYYILFVYRNNGISQIATGYGTIDLYYPRLMTLTRVSVNTTATTSTTSTNSSTSSVNTAIPEFSVWGTAIPLTLSISLAAVIVRRRR